MSSPGEILNPWKWIAIGMALVASTALITGVVVAHYAGSANPNPDNAQVAAVAPDAGQLQNAPRTSSTTAGSVTGASSATAAAETSRCRRRCSCSS